MVEDKGFYKKEAIKKRVRDRIRPQPTTAIDKLRQRIMQFGSPPTLATGGRPQQ